MIKKLLQIISNPLFSILGWMAAILCALGMYYFYNSPQDPELSYLIKPVRAVIVRSEYSSGINVYYENNILKSDLTAAQITIWNNGKGAIKKENILDQVTIHTENNTPILEAKIIKASREVTQVSLDTNLLQNGEVRVNWNILEQDDGATVQIIYEGNPEILITVNGVIQGQRQINRLDAPEKTIYRQDFNRPLRKAFEFYILGVIISGIAVILLIAFVIFHNKEFHDKLFTGVLGLVLLICLPILVYELLYGYVEPPFGF